MSGALPVQLKALWTWDKGVPTGFPAPPLDTPTSPTKTGLLPSDIVSFVGIPLIYRGKPPVLMTDAVILQRLRWAEDWLEQETGLLLCPTAVASPPARSPAQANIANILAVGGGAQVQGVDYDLPDTAYDFELSRTKDNGWVIQSLRYRPLRIFDGTITAIKQMAYVYPLLDQFCQIPVTWYVEDLDFGQIRVVPSGNLQMLPLFAMQLGILGFSDSIPGGIWMQYTAGLQAVDYQMRFQFVQELVLAQAAISILSSLQGTLNMGLESTTILADGVQTQFKYRPDGAYNDLIKRFTMRRDELLETARWQVGGPRFNTIA